LEVLSVLDSTTVAERLPSYRSRVSNGSSLHARGVDKRTAPARRYRDLVLSFAEGLGGADRLNEAERALCRTAAGITVELEKLQAAAASGCEVDAETLTRLANSQARVIQAIRRKTPRPASSTPSFADKLRARHSGAMP
jgi:hypothetical protein